MVSTSASSYASSLVRLAHDPVRGGLGAQPVPSELDGVHAGRPQPLRIGSYIEVPDRPALPRVGSFTVQAWVFATSPGAGAQAILSHWCDESEAGYAVVVDKHGQVAFWLGDGDGSCRIRTERPLQPRTWYFVAASLDAPSRTARVVQRPLQVLAFDRVEVTSERVLVDKLASPDQPLLIGALGDRTADGDAIATGHFNGKLERPCLFGSALSDDQLDALYEGAPPESLGAELVADWDFSAEIGTRTILDRSGNRLHGQTVNAPMRAATGHRWKGEVVDFRHDPQQYGAIHFHDDDLDDAGWENDLELTIADELPSGIYAARLRANGDEDLVPFFVRPSRDAAKPIAFLAPTLSYIAYGNHSSSWATLEREDCDRLGVDYDAVMARVGRADRYVADNRLLSLYERHSDGSGSCYSSRLRPIVNMRPGYQLALVNAPHQFSADLDLVDWLGAKGFDHDVIADEDLHWEGADLLCRHRVVVTGTHPEYWTTQMLDALEDYLADGGRLMYLGGNGFYWVTSIHPEDRHLIEVRRGPAGTRTWEAAPGETHHSSTGEPGGLWRHRGRAAQTVVGVGTTAQGFDRALPYQPTEAARDPRAQFIFEGVSENGAIGAEGSVLGGAAGFEVDRFDHELGSPHHALVVASANGFSDAYQAGVEWVLEADSRQGGSVNPKVRADLVYFEGPNDGAVFSVGSMSWCGALAADNYDGAVSRITSNVLSAFMREGPLPSGSG